MRESGFKATYHINRLVAENYKNLGPLDVSFGSLNILIGPNSSGKSNLVNIFRFLENASLPSVDEVSSFDKAIMQLGGSDILDKTVKRPGQVNLEFYLSSLPPEEVQSRLRLTLLFVPGNRFPVIYREDVAVERRKGEGFNDKMLFRQNQHEQETIEGAILAAGPIPLYNLLGAFSHWHFYNANSMNLKRIREAEPKVGQGDRYLTASGENLTLVLHNLMEDSLEFEERINQAMQGIWPLTRRIRTVFAGQLSLAVQWYIEDTPEPFYLREMSDGLVRMLCWATILHSPQLPALLVIEEPEMGIHVAWLEVLAHWIKNASLKTQIIISTHSPDLLDHFTDEVENVLVFSAPERDTGHFAINRLTQESVASWLQEGWKLGDLYRVGDPSVGGWPW